MKMNVIDHDWSYVWCTDDRSSGISDRCVLIITERKGIQKNRIENICFGVLTQWSLWITTKKPAFNLW